MDGVIIIDKPVGWTSHDVVARVRRTLNQKRVGHTGTLDPFATGVMVVLVGQATRIAQFLAGDTKEYEAVVRLGYATDTGDLTGARIAAEHKMKSLAELRDAEADIERALAALRGETEQVPPMYSAVKVGGRKLYELARRGEEIERAPRRITVEMLEALRGADGRLFAPHATDETVDLTIRVVCSAGTYVRVLAETIGERLGTKAHLAALRRTRAGDFGIASAVTLEQLQTERSEAVTGSFSAMPFLISPAAALARMAFVHLTGEEAQRTRHGMALDAARYANGLRDAQHVKMIDAAGELIAIGVYQAERKQIRPRVNLAAQKI